MTPVKMQLHNVVKHSVSRQTSNQAEYAVRNEAGAGIALWVRTYKRVQVQVPNHVMWRLQR
jgi:hypothetical protein